MKNEIKWVACQTLIGGMSIGFENAFGVPPLAIITAGFGNDKHYIKYMNEKRGFNIPVINMESDYKTFKSDEDKLIFERVVSKGIDVLQHVAICSGLSQLNSVNEGSKARGDADNDQNQNMYALTELGFRMKAKVVSFENAPAAYTKSGEKVIERLKEKAQEAGYSTQLFRTDTLLHGIPQSRKRTFIQFYKDGNPGLFEYEHKEYTPLPVYLEEVGEGMPHWGEQVAIDSKDQFYEFILHYSGEETYYAAMKKLGGEKNTWTALQLTDHVGFDEAVAWFEQRAQEEGETSDKDKYLRARRIALHCKNKRAQGLGYWDSTTYLANDGLYVNAVISKNIHRSLHPVQERGYNIRELLHLMGHPHDFEMIEPLKNWNHISQNVPVKTATHIGTQIRKYLDGELQVSSTEFVKQDNIKQRLDTPSHPKQEEW
jgi:site-specific DNA-cytosine methylase